MQITISHRPKDSAGWEHMGGLHVGLKGGPYSDELQMNSQYRTKAMQSQHTQFWSSGGEPDFFHCFARAVTAAYPSPFLPPSASLASHSHIAAFFKSRTEPMDSRETISCE
jgi:hypothetical protein